MQRQRAPRSPLSITYSIIHPGNVELGSVQAGLALCGSCFVVDWMAPSRINVATCTILASSRLGQGANPAEPQPSPGQPHRKGRSVSLSAAIPRNAIRKVAREVRCVVCQLNPQPHVGVSETSVALGRLFFPSFRWFSMACLSRLAANKNSPLNHKRYAPKGDLDFRETLNPSTSLRAGILCKY